MPVDTARVARLAAIPHVPDQPFVEGLWKPVRAYLGITAFGTNAYVATEPGQVIIEEHDELPDDGTAGDEELYVVLRGQVEFRLDGQPVDAWPGTLVFVPAAVKRVGIARTANAAVLAVGAVPGKPYERKRWERQAMAAFEDRRTPQA
jgi:quercetin dioxygenase-like cupin family protein